MREYSAPAPCCSAGAVEDEKRVFKKGRTFFVRISLASPVGVDEMKETNLLSTVLKSGI